MKRIIALALVLIPRARRGPTHWRSAVPAFGGRSEDAVIGSWAEYGMTLRRDKMKSRWGLGGSHRQFPQLEMTMRGGVFARMGDRVTLSWSSTPPLRRDQPSQGDRHAG